MDKQDAGTIGSDAGDSIEILVSAAQAGSKDALERVIVFAQGYIYNLALRMLQLPSDAEDATQEILIKLITHLGQFRGESSFSTWVYRLASNALLNMAQRDHERNRLSFDQLSQRIDFSLASYEETLEESSVDQDLTEEVKRSCTLGMLMCLNREDRLTIILAEMFDLSSDDGAYVMEMTPTAFRKRLSRARKVLLTFVTNRCGIVNPANPCRCNKHVANKIRVGTLNPAALQYAQPHDVQSLIEVTRSQFDTDAFCRAVALIRSHPAYIASTDHRGLLKQILDAPDHDG